MTRVRPKLGRMMGVGMIRDQPHLMRKRDHRGNGKYKWMNFSIQILGVDKSHGEGLLDPTVLAIVVSIGSLFSCDWPFLPQPRLVFFLHVYHHLE